MRKILNNIYDYIAFITKLDALTLISTFSRLFCYFLGIRRIMNGIYVLGLIQVLCMIVLTIFNIFIFFQKRKQKFNQVKEFSIEIKKDMSKKEKIEFLEGLIDFSQKCIDDAQKELNELKKGENDDE